MKSHHPLRSRMSVITKARAGGPQQIRQLRPGVAAADETDHGHAGGNARGDADRRILRRISARAARTRRVPRGGWRAIRGESDVAWWLARYR